MTRERRLWLIVGAGSAIAAGLVARRAVTEAWRHGRGEEPPADPADPEVRWRSVLLWAGVSGVCVGMARVFGRGAADHAWRNLLGREPPAR